MLRLLWIKLLLLHSFLLLPSALAQDVTNQDLQECRASLKAKDSHRAVELCQKAIAYARLNKNLKDESIALHNLGSAYFQLEQFDLAKQYYLKAIKTARSADYTLLIKKAYFNLGVGFDRQNEYQLATESVQKSLSVQPGTKVTEAEVSEHYRLDHRARIFLGTLAQNQNQLQDALNYFEESLAIAKDRVNLAAIEESEDLLKKLYLRIGHKSHYVQELVTKLKQRKKSPVPPGQKRIQTNPKTRSVLRLLEVRTVVSQYRAGKINNLGKAYSLLHTAMTEAVEAGDINQQVSVWIKLNELEQEFGQKEAGHTLLKQALQLANDHNDTEAEIRVLMILGEQALRSSQYEAAEQYHQGALDLTKRARNFRKEASLLTDISNIYFDIGEWSISLKNAQQAVSILEKHDASAQLKTGLINLAEKYLALGQYRKSEKVLRQAIQQGDRLVTQFETDRDRAVSFESQAYPYMLLHHSLLAQKKYEEALELSEQSRSLALNTALYQQGKETQPSQEIDVSSPDIKTIQQFARDTKSTVIQYSILPQRIELPKQIGYDLKLIHSTSSGLQMSKEPKLVGTASLQRRSKLSYNITSDSSLHIWVVQPSGKIHFRAVNLNEFQSLPGAQEQLLASLEQPGFRGDSFQSSSESKSGARDLRSKRARVIITGNQQSTRNQHLQYLHQSLIAPIADLLPKSPQEKVVFVPQGSLFFVPFAALQDTQGNYLIDQHTIVTAPSIQTLMLTQRNKARVDTQNALIVGNPTMPVIANEDQSEQLLPLPGAEQEAEQIGQMFNTQPLIGAQATETEIKRRMENADAIHLATHGLMDYQEYGQTPTLELPGAIALAPSEKDDGLLTAHEILDLKLKADLAVLSACNTAHGKISNDGVMGLSRALMVAGIPSIIVSQWSVPDAPTAELMTEFYRQLQKYPNNKAQALRQAMLIAKKSYPDPLDWAAFSLVGSS